MDSLDRDNTLSKNRPQRIIKKSASPAPALNHDEIITELRRIKDSNDLLSIPLEEYKRIGASMVAQEPDILMAVTEELIAMDDRVLLSYFDTTLIGSLIKKMDPKALGEWLSGLQSESDRNYLLACAAAMYFDKNPDAVNILLNTTSADDDRISIIGGYYNRIITVQPQRAVREFLSKVPGETGYKELYRITRLLPSNVDFQSILGLIPLESGEAAMEATSKILETWARFDPKKAADYAWSTEKISPDVMKSAMDRWYRSTPDEARTWLYNEPSSLKRDHALGQIALSGATSDPKGSLAAAGRIGDEEMRRATQQEIYQRWHSLQPEIAEEAMKQAQGN